ncbi:ubiquitin carboxyl-terminal hydrolase 12/46 [Schistosoma bovis]|uniref:ubiquitinyl hydrolase 1 n=1 Tax=Schistosoma bovis TaxID=6184 RepID=A0A430PZ90_SCHBO|nr:ubiquitin carboxyl-terminal hydrolase 12/46 [Schistosoma bovis]
MRFLESFLRINCLKMVGLLRPHIHVVRGSASSQLEKEIASDQLLSGERYFGLVNFGNTCYCNSVIQALFFCKPFRDKVLQYNDRAKNPKKETLLTCLSDLFYSVVSQQRRVGQMRPKKFIQKLKRENGMYDLFLRSTPTLGLFDNYLQQDAHEFLNYLLNKIADIIRAEQQPTGVEDAEDPSDCEMTDVSESNRKHSGRNWIHEIFQGSLTKKLGALTSSDSSNDDRLYNLMAVVVHSGSGPNRGHYVTLVKSHGLWFLFDDELVEKIHRTNIEDFFGSSTETSKSSYTAYILFYLDAKVASGTSTATDYTSTIVNNSTIGVGGSNGSPTSSMSSGCIT